MTDADRLEPRRLKQREAQRRYYDKHKRKKPDPQRPSSYCPEYIQACNREYYLHHRDEIIARSKQRYQDTKALRKTQHAAATAGPTQEAPKA
jgi:hypothetical protein